MSDEDEFAERFEWDKNKADVNRRKHGISFEEAKTIFYDPLRLTFPDDEHSLNEERFISIGESLFGRLLTVIHTEGEDNVRIISSRKANSTERELYES
jgi:uncharacterized protein